MNDDWFDIGMKIVLLVMMLLSCIFMVIGIDYICQTGFDSHGVAIKGAIE